jgi:hypothetical protein
MRVKMAVFRIKCRRPRSRILAEDTEGIAEALLEGSQGLYTPHSRIRVAHDNYDKWGAVSRGNAAFCHGRNSG